MKKNRNILLITLFTPLLALATDPMPGDFGDGDDSNPVDVTIDSNLYILIIAGFAYVGYKLYYNKK